MIAFVKKCRSLCLGLVLSLINNCIIPASTYAQEFALPSPGQMVRISPTFTPPVLKGIKVHPDNPFKLEFVLDKGESSLPKAAMNDESIKLIKYFLAGLTIPEKDLWVNLSPYEKDRIIPQAFGLTEMGRDLLAEDYILKQVTASLIYPDSELGKKFWKAIYEESAKRYGTTNVPVNTFNKVWIVPEKAVIFENAKAAAAYVVESKLKVMLEEDYMATKIHDGIKSTQGQVNGGKDLGAQIVREIVIPELTKEVNEHKNFACLRQVYNSLILAAWYKKKISNSLLSLAFTDRNKINGMRIQNPYEKQKIYDRYLQAFKKGVFNLIKEIPRDAPSLNHKEQVMIPRKYFAGGETFTHIQDILQVNYAMSSENAVISNDQALVQVDLAMMQSSIDQRARQTLKAIFNNSTHEPDPNLIYELAQSGLSIQDVFSIANDFPDLKAVSSPIMDKMYLQFMRLLPYMDQYYERVMATYPDRNLLFAGRDGRTFYLYFKIKDQLMKRKSRAHYFAGSNAFLLKMATNFDTKSNETQLLREYLDQIGINEDSLGKGEKFVVLDTGFRGTVGAIMKVWIKNLYPQWAENVDELFASNLVSMSKPITHPRFGNENVAPRVTHIAFPGSSEIQLDYIGSDTAESLNQLFPDFNIRWEHEPDLNRRLAVIWQIAPKYHGQFSDLRRSNDSTKVIAVTNNKPFQRNLQDFKNTGLNDDPVNPVGAIVLEIEMIRWLIEQYKGLEYEYHDKFKYITADPLENSSDMAMRVVLGTTNTGGVDMTSVNNNLLINNQDGQVTFHVDQAMLQKFRESSGLTIGSMAILSIKNLKHFLEIN